MKANNKISYTLICILAVVFLVSSVTKMVNIHSFAMEVGEYLDLYMPNWMHGMQMTCAISVCVVEFVLGLMGLRHKYAKVVSMGITMMLIFFVYLTAQNAFFPTMFGSVESCGCFGELIHFSPMASFVKSVVLLVISVVSVLMSFKSLSLKDEFGMKKMLKDLYVYVALVSGCVLTMFSYYYVNNMTHGVYITLYIVICMLISISIYLLCRRNAKKAY